MINRSIFRENAHRKGIYREAVRLMQEGWHVLANHIPGYLTPPEIEGYVPDIYAIKSAETFIVEVSTIAGLDMEKFRALKDYSIQFEEIEFLCWIVDSAGCRMLQVE
jgi:hypothetical protein